MEHVDANISEIQHPKSSDVVVSMKIEDRWSCVIYDEGALWNGVVWYAEPTDDYHDYERLYIDVAGDVESSLEDLKKLWDSWFNKMINISKF